MITFKRISKNEVHILMYKKKVGRIFSPAGSGDNVTNAIQVCGFERAYDLWGCGVYCDSKGKMRQDIQLMFNPDTVNQKTLGYGKANVFSTSCYKCYNKVKPVHNAFTGSVDGVKCTCDELVVDRADDLPLKYIPVKNPTKEMKQ